MTKQPIYPILPNSVSTVLFTHVLIIWVRTSLGPASILFISREHLFKVWCWQQITVMGIDELGGRVVAPYPLQIAKKFFWGDKEAKGKEIGRNTSKHKERCKYREPGPKWGKNFSSNSPNCTKMFQNILKLLLEASPQIPFLSFVMHWYLKRWWLCWNFLDMLYVVPRK